MILLPERVLMLSLSKTNCKYIHTLRLLNILTKIGKERANSLFSLTGPSYSLTRGPKSWTRLVDPTLGSDAWTRHMVPLKQGVVLDCTHGLPTRWKCLTCGSSPHGTPKNKELFLIGLAEP